MNGKPGSRSPVSRLRGLATVGSAFRPKLRKALSVNSENELFRGVDSSSREALSELGMSKVSSLQREARNRPVLSFKLRASTWKDSDAVKGNNPSSGEAEIVNKHSDAKMEAKNVINEFVMDCKDFSLNIRSLIQQILSAQLDTLEYNHELCGAKCKTISQMIENGVKSLYSVQHKITALVYIGAIRDRGIEMASQCVWNPSTDNFVMATFENESLFASAIVFATLFNDE